MTRARVQSHLTTAWFSIHHASEPFAIFDGIGSYAFWLRLLPNAADNTCRRHLRATVWLALEWPRPGITRHFRT
jgi:hypothetical protein